MSSSRRMEQVFYQAHIKASNYILRHTSHRTRSIIEHLALGLAVCSFCVVIITHRTFVHREDIITPRRDVGGSFSSKASSSCDDAAHHYDYFAAANYSPIVEGRNVTIYSILVQLLLRVTAWCTRRLHISSTTAATTATTTTTTTTTTPTSTLWSKKIPISCLKSIPGFRNDADVNHILLHLVTHDNTTAAITNHGHVKERGGGGGGGGSRSSAFTIHRGHENEQIVVVSSMPPSCIIIDGYNNGSTTVDACSREMTTFLARRGYSSVHVVNDDNNNANDDDPLLLFQKEEKEKLPIALPTTILSRQQHQQQQQQQQQLPQQQQQQQQQQLPQHSPILYSYSHTQGLLRLQPSLQHTHNISTQFIIVSPTDVNCFGEPFTQNIIFRFIGPDTAILNWILGLQSSFSSSNSSTSTTTATIHQRPRFVYHWKTHKELDLDIYDMDHYAFSSKSTRRTDTAAAATTTTMYEAVSPSLPVATMNMLLSSSSSSSSSSSWACGKQYPFYRLIRFLSFKLLVLASTLLIFFLTTSLVSFTFQETQDRMLEFTFQLQSRVRANLPLGTLIFDHVLENLVFVPIMVGMIFFLIEFYGDDKFLAFMVLSMVWVCEVFSAISVRSIQGMHFFPRVFFLYFTLFHVYFFSCPVGFTYASLASTILFLFHTMLFFWNRYELPAVHAGLITPQSPRMLRLGIDRDRGVEGEGNTGRAVPPSPSRVQSSYLQMPVLQRHQQHPRLNVIPRMNSDDDDRSSVTAPTVPLSTTARSSRLSRTDDSSNDLLTPDSNPQSSLLFAAPSYPGPMRSYVAAASTSLQSIRSMASFHSLTSIAGGRTSPNYIFEGGYNYGDNSEGDCDDGNEEELTL